MRSRWIGSGILVVLALAACSSDHTTIIVVHQEAGVSDAAADDGGVATPAGCIRGSGQSASMTVGQGGADITLETLVLHFEPDAIASSTKVTVTSSVGCPGDTTLASETPLYEITPAGLALAIPATVSITYPGGSHGVLLYGTTPQGDLGYLATSTERNEVHGSINQLGAVWVASYPALGGFNATIVPTQIDAFGNAALLLSNDADFEKTDCTVDPGAYPVTWNFVFDATKQDYFPRAVLNMQKPGAYTVTCPTAKLTASAPPLTVRSTPEVTFTATASTIAWNAPNFVQCILDGVSVAASGSQAPTAPAPLHTLVCYDATGVRVSRWAVTTVH